MEFAGQVSANAFVGEATSLPYRSWVVIRPAKFQFICILIEKPAPQNVGQVDIQA